MPRRASRTRVETGDRNMDQQPAETDPKRFVLRMVAPRFDITDQKEAWESWRIQWEAYTTVSGIERL